MRQTEQLSKEGERRTNRELLLDVVLSQNRVDNLEHTRLVQMHVTEPDGALVQDRAQVDLGEVDGADGAAVVDVPQERTRDLGSDHPLRLLGRATNVRREDEVRARAESGRPAVQLVREVRAVLGRFGGEDVDGCAGEVARLERGDERGDVDHLPTRVVEQVRPVLHLGDLGRADHVGRFGQLGHVQGEEVGRAEELVERVELLGGSEGHDGHDVLLSRSAPTSSLLIIHALTK